MYKVVFDADALIKLVRAGIFERIRPKCMISEQVYEETVTEGEKRMHADALQIERMVQKRKISVHKVSLLTQEPSLGLGELSTLALHQQAKADLIVSDDRRFLVLLEEKAVPFLVPTEFIVSLVRTHWIKKEKGISALRRIQEYVRKENYESAIEALGGKP